MSRADPSASPVALPPAFALDWHSTARGRRIPWRNRPFSAESAARKPVCRLGVPSPRFRPEMPRTEQEVYAGIDRMIRGTFQCWGTANDLIGHDDIEGCGAGGGVQGLALAWDAQAEWRPLAGNLVDQGEDLTVGQASRGQYRAGRFGKRRTANSLAVQPQVPHPARSAVYPNRLAGRRALELPSQRRPRDADRHIEQSVRCPCVFRTALTWRLPRWFARLASEPRLRP